MNLILLAFVVSLPSSALDGGYWWRHGVWDSALPVISNWTSHQPSSLFLREGGPGAKIVMRTMHSQDKNLRLFIERVSEPTSDIFYTRLLRSGEVHSRVHCIKQRACLYGWVLGSSVDNAGVHGNRVHLTSADDVSLFRHISPWLVNPSRVDVLMLPSDRCEVDRTIKMYMRPRDATSASAGMRMLAWWEWLRELAVQQLDLIEHAHLDGSPRTGMWVVEYVRAKGPHAQGSDSFMYINCVVAEWILTNTSSLPVLCAGVGLEVVNNIRTIPDSLTLGDTGLKALCPTKEGKRKLCTTHSDGSQRCKLLCYIVGELKGHGKVPTRENFRNKIIPEAFSASLAAGSWISFDGRLDYEVQVSSKSGGCVLICEQMPLRHTVGRQSRNLIAKEVEKTLEFRTRADQELSVGASVTLRSGFRIPRVGLGTASLRGHNGVRTIIAAFRLGYRLVDTAVMYFNSGEIRKAIRASRVPRNELYIASKVYVDPPDRVPNYSAVIFEAKRHIAALGLTYLDLYLLHNPSSKAKEQWRALVRLRNVGLVRSIGVSNFRVKDLETLGLERPSVLQSDFSLFSAEASSSPQDNERLLLYCQERNIHPMMHSPLRGFLHHQVHHSLEGSAASVGLLDADMPVAKVLLLYGLNRGMTVIPSTRRFDRLLLNLIPLRMKLATSDIQSLLESVLKKPVSIDDVAWKGLFVGPGYEVAKVCPTVPGTGAFVARPNTGAILDQLNRAPPMLPLRPRSPSLLPVTDWMAQPVAVPALHGETVDDVARRLGAGLCGYEAVLKAGEEAVWGTRSPHEIWVPADATCRSPFEASFKEYAETLRDPNAWKAAPLPAHEFHFLMPPRFIQSSWLPPWPNMAPSWPNVSGSARGSEWGGASIFIMDASFVDIIQQIAGDAGKLLDDPRKTADPRMIAYSREQHVLALDLEVLPQLQHLIEILVSDYLAPHLKEHVFGCDVSARHVTVSRNQIPNHPEDNVAESLMWHWDGTGYEMVKILVYLTEVDEDHACMVLLEHSTNGTPVRMRNRYFPSGFSPLPRPWLAELLKQGYKARCLGGPVGTTLVFAPDLVHRASRPLPGKHRDSILFEFVPAHGGPVIRKPHAFWSEYADDSDIAPELITTVRSQAGCSKAKAVAALRVSDSDTVEAIRQLSTS